MAIDLPAAMNEPSPEARVLSIERNFSRSRYLIEDATGHR